MLKFCLRYIVAFLVFILSLIFLTNPVFATHKCGTDNICQSADGHETCSNCPQDCGVCPTPTSTPTPVPTATPTPTPTSTPTPTPTTSSSSSPTSTPTPTPTLTPSVYYPFVVLTPYSPNPTNQESLTFLGKANIEQGTISAVEFSIDASLNWQEASPTDKSFNSRNENFTFTTQSLFEGEHIITVRAKSNASIYTQENLVVGQFENKDA